jgi:hypothetical protein
MASGGPNAEQICQDIVWGIHLDEVRVRDERHAPPRNLWVGKISRSEVALNETGQVVNEGTRFLQWIPSGVLHPTGASERTNEFDGIDAFVLKEEWAQQVEILLPQI